MFINIFSYFFIIIRKRIRTYMWLILRQLSSRSAELVLRRALKQLLTFKLFFSSTSLCFFTQAFKSHLFVLHFFMIFCLHLSRCRERRGGGGGCAWFREFLVARQLTYFDEEKKPFQNHAFALFLFRNKVGIILTRLRWFFIWGICCVDCRLRVFSYSALWWALIQSPL